jgi:DNA-binding beta-propeller fold protein YncE
MKCTRWFKWDYRVLFAALMTFAVAACGGGGGGESKAPIPDVAGVWAGTWSGNTPGIGAVSGNWDAEVDQTGVVVQGTIYLSGDVDCPDGTVTGSAASGQATGDIDRLPCLFNEWVLTAFNQDQLGAGGSWSQPDAGASGTFTGIRIARRDGPRIAYATPPGGLPGTVVMLAGEGLPLSDAGVQLEFGAAPAEIDVVDNRSLITRVPAGADFARIYLRTPEDTVISPRPFNTEVTTPVEGITKTIPIPLITQGIVFSPDGRKAYVTSKQTGSVAMIDTASGQMLAEAPFDVTGQGLAISPDGRQLYVATAQGVAVFHAGAILGGSMVLLDTFDVPAGDGIQPGGQGLAVSPDARLVGIADNRPGGAVRIFEPATSQVVGSIAANQGERPTAVGFSPDGKQLWMAFAVGVGAGRVVAYDLAAQQVLGLTIQLGLESIGFVFAPDGERLFVVDRLDGTVSAVNSLTGAIERSITVSGGANGIAISPDGKKIYVPGSGSNSIHTLDTAVFQQGGIPMPYQPNGIAVSPDGKRAYVTMEGNALVELGGTVTLTVLKSGSGIGTVTSTPDGISCGATCRGDFDAGKVVTLAATADNTSVFRGWTGDPDCSDGMVTMDQNKTCTAEFVSISPPGSGGAGCFISTATDRLL